ncbi:molybdenum ABC transporter ATP-binding protein [Salinisphaera sp.]|uniref:molybdenum ABC transporter ATP-binding protein n=1 Tax=Salinisphaera sp. TaxID=1914330 RepID=UPI002D799FD5|nr:molybdenum ABC transporter ATP-binding protein [Salinisphaera sp.]HET7314162.1 molybdenum ABC transporter ATP-binding protein [Salinisphaera sp.]
MSIDLDVRLRQGGFELACRLCSEQRVIGLFGPSGAGKSSLLRVIAGLSRPDSGTIAIAGRRVFDSARGLHLPAHRRRIGMVFQQPRLFPHLNVRHNLDYGGWFSRRRPSRTRFGQVVDMLDIGDLLDRRTRDLSGGEAQRVAIGRALLCDPELLLLDEPLASLDAPRKREVLPYIERLSAQSALPIVFVSHQLDELLRLANRHVAAIRNGEIVFSGPTAEFLARADLLGEEAGPAAGALLEARLAAHEPEHGLSVLACPRQKIYVPRLTGHRIGERVRLHVRARDVILARRPPEQTSALNQLVGSVIEIRRDDTDYAVDVILDIDGQRLDARITRRSAAALDPKPGQTLHAVIKSLALAEQAWQRLGGL